MKILIADDDGIIRMGLAAMLKEQGHAVIACVDGRDAVQVAIHQKPDLAILDINMPRLDGLHAAREIRRAQALPIVILTAYGQDDLVDKAAHFPIHAYLIKPVGSAELNAAIKVASQRFHEAQVLEQEKARLQRALEDRKAIDQAKGKLIASGLAEEEAYRAIQRHARENRISMKAAAQKILRWEQFR
jgi:response regulator NasT